MLTVDPQGRASKLAELMDILRRDAPAEDRDLVLALAPVIFADMPDRLALGLPAQALSGRIRSHFKFIAREIPPAQQLYKGLPGIHVGVRNPSEAEARDIGAGHGLPLESTVVETHTVDTPFIFESLKHYFQKAGLRVFSAIHPIFTVRRQWERVVWIGSSHDEGSKECYCHFQIEPVESKERLRRIEHEVFAVLKCVFLAVTDFKDMGRVCQELGGRVRSRTGNDVELGSARSFLDWLRDDNYVFMGTVGYRAASDGRLDRVDETATGVFTDETLLPVVFPGVMEHVEQHLTPASGDNRIIDIDYCNNASAIYHLEPIEDLLVREWGADGQLLGSTLLLGRFARGAFAQRADRIPLLKEKHDAILRDSNAIPNSYAWREIRAAFNSFPKTELFYADARDLQQIIEERATRPSTSPSRGCATRTRPRRRSAARSPTPSARSPSAPRWIAGRSPSSSSISTPPAWSARSIPRRCGASPRPSSPSGKTGWRRPSRRSSGSARGGASSAATSPSTPAAASTASRLPPSRFPTTSVTSTTWKGASRSGSSRAPPRRWP